MASGSRIASPLLAWSSPRHDLEQRGLAGAVGSDDADLGAVEEREGDVVEDDLVTVGLAHVAQCEDVLSHAGEPSREPPARLDPRSDNRPRPDAGRLRPIAASGGIGDRLPPPLRHRPWTSGAGGLVNVARAVGEVVADRGGHRPRRRSAACPSRSQTSAHEPAVDHDGVTAAQRGGDVAGQPVPRLHGVPRAWRPLTHSPCAGEAARGAGDAEATPPGGPRRPHAA